MQESHDRGNFLSAKSEGDLEVVEPQRVGVLRSDRDDRREKNHPVEFALQYEAAALLEAIPLARHTFCLSLDLC